MCVVDHIQYGLSSGKAIEAKAAVVFDCCPVLLLERCLLPFRNNIPKNSDLKPEAFP